MTDAAARAGRRVTATRAGLDDWVRRYRAAWESNDPAAIADLFANGAEYYPEPYARPWRGRDEIVSGWLARRDEPGATRFRFEVIAVDGELGVVRAATEYAAGASFENLWEVTLDAAGRCTRFVEWWMQRP